MVTRSENFVRIVGHLGANPTFRSTADKKTVASFSVATNDKGPSAQEETEWHRVVVFGRAAEDAREKLKKGVLVRVVGTLKTRPRRGDDGVERPVTEIHSSDICVMTPLGGKPKEPKE